MVKMNLAGFFQTLFPDGVLMGSAFLENKDVICTSFSRAWCQFCDSVNRAQLSLLPLPTLLNLVDFPGRRHYQVRPLPLTGENVHLHWGQGQSMNGRKQIRRNMFRWNKMQTRQRSILLLALPGSPTSSPCHPFHSDFSVTRVEPHGAWLLAGICWFTD